MNPGKKKLPPWQINLGIFALALLFLIIFFYPMVFRALRPGGIDVVSNIGNSHQFRLFERETKTIVRWNKTLFSGMPWYQFRGTQVFSLDKIISWAGQFVYLYVWIYFIGFAGMFLLLRSFKLSYLSAVFGALGFILFPLYMSYLSVGHFTKLRSIMYLPWVTFFFISFLNKKNILYLIGWIFSFSILVRCQHYQIIFYQLLLLSCITTYCFFRFIKNKRYKILFQKSALLAAASLLVIVMSAQILLTIGEYTPCSIRGESEQTGSGGLSYSYATQWSLHPAEMANWLMPRFFGGKSAETYTGEITLGNKSVLLNEKTVPGYWGQMPFTESFYYIGAVVIFMALLGLILNWKNNFIKLLLILFSLSLFVSFGRHVPYLYNLFFRFVPLFNKFRVPYMIMVLLHFILIILAGFGLESLFSLAKREPGKLKKAIIGVSGLLLGLGLIPFLAGSRLALSSARDSMNTPQALEILKAIRLDMMQQDGLRLIVLVLLVGLFCYLFIQGKLKRWVFASLLILILAFDLIPFVLKSEGKLLPQKQVEQAYFQKTAVDKAILQDESYYRVFPLTDRPFANSRWSYYHNSIGGYHAAKLRIYQDIIEEYFQTDNPQKLTFNHNILRLLNAKYIISRVNILPGRLKPYFYDEQSKNSVYMFKEVKPAWVVNRIQVQKDKDKRLKMLGESSFDPYQTAILEEEIAFKLPSTNQLNIKVKVKEASFNIMEYEVFIEQPALLVMSEIYYPKGWHSYDNGKEIPLYKTDHLLRSVYLSEPGQHLVRLEFKPKSYYLGYYLSLGGHLVAFFLLGLFTFINLYPKRITNEKNPAK